MLSICIVNWNTRDLLRACLRSLHDHAPAEPHEILVADNASRDGSANMVAAEFPAVRLFANDGNLGYAAGNNQLLRAARGRWLLLLNADTAMDPQLDPMPLDSLVAHLRANPFVGAVAGRLVHPDGRTQRSCRGFPTAVQLGAEWTGLARLFPRRLGRYRMRGFDHRTCRPVDQPMASCLLLRRRALQRIGLIDERFPIFFNDVDLCLRLRRDGWRVDYQPAASIVHHGGASTRQLPLRMLRESRDSLLAFYTKHYRVEMSGVGYALATAAIRFAFCIREWRT